jgi:cytochrome c oxidase assembly protein subunit 15
VPSDRPAEAIASDGASVQRLLRLLASAGVALMLAVIVSSAYLRSSQAGLACSDWPACYGRTGAPIATTTRDIARFVHRVAAGGVGMVLVAALLIGVTQRPLLARQCAIVGAAFAIALALAVLGSRSAPEGGVPSVALVLANLGFGFALLALTWWLRISTQPRDRTPERPPSWLRLAAALALGLAIGEIALGALTSAKFAALACPAFPGCGADWPATALMDALDPFVERAFGPNGAILRTPQLAALHSMHRLGALLLAAVGGAVALGLARSGRAGTRLGALIGALLVGELTLGAAMLASSFPSAVPIAHNVCAALLLLALIAANRAIYWRSSA